MILMIDNYDSFTYNLVDYLEQLGEQVIIKRNDKISISDIEDLAPEVIVISPGPKTPEQAGISKQTIKEFKGQIPILGICLGHQTIATVFNAQITKAQRPTHGKVEAIKHYHKGSFKGLANPLQITRYHSLVVAKDSLPSVLEITAETNSGEIMGLQHQEYLLEGIQFHPEALLTAQGKQLLANFLARARGGKSARKNRN